MLESEIVNRINSFSRWHYQFDIKGQLTPIHDEKKINRHVQRKKYFFEPLVDLCGGSLAGKRILDLGCNAGFWALQAVNSGCDFIVGIDGRQMHVDQANFVFDAKEIEKNRYHFLEGDIFNIDLAAYGPFDIVFFLGLMYHINKPVELLEKIAAVNSDLLLIDTIISTDQGSHFTIHHEGLDDPRNAIKSELVLIPTRQAVLDVVRQFGYQSHVLEPKFQDYTGAKSYLHGKRKAFLCAKHTDLSGLSK